MEVVLLFILSNMHDVIVNKIESLVEGARVFFFSYNEIIIAN
jgi:hypothetical protein